MKLHSHWSIAGYVASITFAIGSFIRYYVLYPDEDKAIAYVTIAGLIFAVSFLYNRIIQLGSTLGGIEDYLADKQEKLK